MDIYREVEKITKEMVAIPSVNGTSGEKDIGVYIENYLRSIPYFAEHPDQVIVKPLKEDALGKKCVCSFEGYKRYLESDDYFTWTYGYCAR